MAKIDEFIKKSTNEEWDTMSARRRACTKKEQKQSFKDMYGFTPKAIKAYESMHYIECERHAEQIEAMVEEHNAMKSKLKELEDLQKNAHTFRKIAGKSVKHCFYATQDAIDKFEALADAISDEYGYEKYLAASYLIEEAVKSFSTKEQNT